MSIITHAAPVLDISGLPAGLYQVRLLGAGYAEAYRVVRQ